MKLSSMTFVGLPLAILLVSGRWPIGADEPKPLSLLAWLRIIDPDKDCEIIPGDEKLTITVPPRNHNLHPVRGVNAPRVLQRVTGDFTVQVKVTGEFLPGAQSTGIGTPFNGAGLLLWGNSHNFLRIERNIFRIDDKLYCYPPLIEHWREGEFAGANDDPVDAEFFKGRSTWLKLARRGKQATVSVSHDGKEWMEIKTVEVEFPEKLSVGVAAINSSNAPFTVHFEEFEIKAHSPEPVRDPR